MTTLLSSSAWARALRWLGSAGLACLLCACAASTAYREGNSLLAAGKIEQGLAKLEEATRADPRNAEYRIALASQRASQVNRLVTAADAHQREGRLSESEKAYRQALTIEPQHTMARQGLEALVVERRHRQTVTEAEALLKKGGESDLGDALERLRPVLAENPQQKEALNLKARINEARSRLPRAETKLAAAFRKPITLEFRDAPLKAVFDVIAKVSGLNFFFDKDLRPDLKATVLAKNTSIEDAVRLLLVTNQLEQRVLNENSVLIYPATPQKLKDYQTLAVRSFYLSNADVKAVSNTIKTLVKTKDLVIDERLGIIMMRDTPEAIRMAERIVALQDLSDPEVMLEVEVMEVKRSRLLDLGVQWPTSVTLAPLQLQGAALTLADLRNLNTSTIQASVGSLTATARKEDQDSNILANPRIRVRNKEKAKVLIGDRVPVITTTSTSTGFVSESVNYVDVGLKLEVEPNIYLDDEVAIKVNLEVSSLVKEVLSKSGSLAYQIGTRGAATVLRLKDGETQILAGLISDEDRSSGNKLPGLGDLPLVGRLFGAQKDDVQRSEILLSITPRIVRAIRRPDLAAAEFESGTETNIGAAPLRLASLEPEKLEGKPALTAAALGPAVLPAVAPAGPAAVAPAAVPAVAAAAATSGSVALSWQAPAQIKVGEQFSAALRITSQGGLRGLPALLAFDPQALQVVAVQEGTFFKQAGGNTNFSQRIDAAQGKVFVTVVRQNSSGGDAGVNGTGTLATVTFKAVKAGDARLQLLSASPEPAPAAPLALPVEQSVRIVP
jgi:general secretion pathway protein D